MFELVSILLVCLFVGCTSNGASNSVLCQLNVDTVGMQTGDLAVRCGYGAESKMVAEVDSFSYSHIGMIIKEKDGYFVIHAVPGESADGRDVLKCEPVDSFYCSERAETGGYARVSCTEKQKQKAVEYALQKVRRGVLFDHDYSLTDTTQMYCTEFVWQSYLHQGVDLAEGRRHVYQLPATDGKFIFPSDILASSKVKIVKTFKSL